MTVSAETPYASSTANGVTTVFPHAFTLLNASDIQVRGLLAGVMTTFVLNVHYTVTGVGSSSGSIVFAVAPANGMVITRYRSVVLQRLTDYQDNGDLLADTINFDFDALWLAMQQQTAQVGGSIRLPYPEQTAELPAAAARTGGYLLGFDVATGAVALVLAGVGTAVALALSLASSIGSSLIGFIQAGAQAIARTVQSKLRDTVHVNDWGGDLKKALQDVPAYTTIVLGIGTYDITGMFKTTTADGVWAGNTKAGIRLQGAGMPGIASDGRSLTGGTILQGTLVNLADGFEAYDLGVDVGADVVDNKYGGTWHEGFIPGVNTTYPTPQTTIKRVKVDRVSALTKPPINGNTATYMHSMLFENLEDCWIGAVDAYGGYHTFVSKVVGLQAGSITARGGELGEAIIFKSDPANKCERNEVSLVRIDGWTYMGVTQPAGALRYEALATGGGANTTDKIKIGTAILKNCVSDSVINSSAGITQNCSIGHLDVDTTAVACAVRLGLAGTDIRRFVIGTFNIVTNGRAFDLGPFLTDVHVGSGIVSINGNSGSPLMTVNNASQTHGRISFQVTAAQTFTYMIQRNGGQVNMDLIEFGGSAAIPSSRFLSSFPGTFTINASNFADSGNAAFGVVGCIYQPYKVGFRGAAKCTTVAAGATIATVAPAPLKAVRFVVPVESGSMASAYVQVDTAGLMTILGTPVLNALYHLNGIEYDTLVQ